MSSVRRWYIYLISAISLQAVVWAVISLLRNLTVLGTDPTAAAFQIAVIIIGLPVFLAHWIWARRLVRAAKEERLATLRRFYLYGMMAGFLAPGAANAFDFLGSLFQIQTTRYRHPQVLTVGEGAVYHLSALLVLAVVWYFHWQIVQTEQVDYTEGRGSAVIRRLYVLGFSAAGLWLTTLGIIHLLRWVLLQFGEPAISSEPRMEGLYVEIIRLILGLPLWLAFWRWAGRLFEGPDPKERESALRKFYLYTAVFAGVMGVVVNLTAILAGIIRGLLGLPPMGDIRDPLPIILGMGVVWVYHWLVLNEDAQREEASPRQAGVWRLYHYLVAGVGLAALLIGLGGLISVLLRSFDTGFGNQLRDQLAWFTSAVAAGLPVWIFPWRSAQGKAVVSGAAGADARRSIVRKIYVYFYLFIATMTVLSSAVFIVFRILNMVFGEAPPTINELGHAIAFSVIAVGVWLYHGAILRDDRRLSQSEQIQELQELRIAVLDFGAGHFAREVIERLEAEYSGLDLNPIVVDAETVKDLEWESKVCAWIASAGLVVAPWYILLPGSAEGLVTETIVQAVRMSAARKVLVPVQTTGWEWAGVERWDRDALVSQVLHAIQQVLEGEPVHLHKPMGIGMIILIAAGGLILLLSIVGPLIEYFSSF